MKFIVSVINPALAKRSSTPQLAPADFSSKHFTHLQMQCKDADDFTCLQKGTLFGIEPKPLPYFLCQMNLTSPWP